jgi:hypothetical protein
VSEVELDLELEQQLPRSPLTAKPILRGASSSSEQTHPEEPEHVQLSPQHDEEIVTAGTGTGTGTWVGGLTDTCVGTRAVVVTSVGRGGA